MLDDLAQLTLPPPVLTMLVWHRLTPCRQLFHLLLTKFVAIVSFRIAPYHHKIMLPELFDFHRSFNV